MEGESNIKAERVEEDSGAGGQRTRFIVLALVVALAVGYMVYAAFPGNALYFLTVSEFMDRPEVQDGRMLRVSGKLVEDSFQRQNDSTRSSFQLRDSQGGPNENYLTASYEGILPDLFFNPHSEVILQGSYTPDQVFQTESVLVKCPSKYQSLEEETEGDA